MKKKIFIFLGALGVILCSFTAIYYWKHPLTAKVVIRSHTFYVDVAVTPPEKELGLGGRASLDQDHGMLFVYDHKEQYPFWMKGMEFPLDFIWIEGNLVADLTRNVPINKNAQPPIYHPYLPVDKILEVNSGVIDKYGIKIGDPVKFITL